MIRHLVLFGLLVCAAYVPGCSAVMAGSGTPPPNMTVLKKGALRAEIQKELGTPTKVSSDERVEYYYREIGDTAAPGRAANLAFWSIFSLGFNEIILLPRETARSRDIIDLEIIVEYDSGRAKRITIQEINQEVPEAQPKKERGTRRTPNR